MTVKELKEILKNHSDDTKIEILYDFASDNINETVYDALRIKNFGSGYDELDDTLSIFLSSVEE